MRPLSEIFFLEGSRSPRPRRLTQLLQCFRFAVWNTLRLGGVEYSETMEVLMSLRYILAGSLLFALVGPAVAATEFYIVRCADKKCEVVETKRAFGQWHF